MTVKELLESGMIDKFQDLQIVECRTGNTLTMVDYMDDTGFWNQIDDYADRNVLCIVPRPAVSEPYLEIRVDDESFPVMTTH